MPSRRVQKKCDNKNYNLGNNHHNNITGKIVHKKGKTIIESLLVAFKKNVIIKIVI